MTRVAAWFARLPRVLERLRRTEAAGRFGEKLAATFLKRAGYRIVAKNMRIGHDEADLIAIDPNGPMLVIVEVKTRRRQDAMPELAVNATKQRRMSRFAAKLKQRREYENLPVRFDVIAVSDVDSGHPQVRHIMHAFDSSL